MYGRLLPAIQKMVDLRNHIFAAKSAGFGYYGNLQVIAVQKGTGDTGNNLTDGLNPAYLQGVENSK